MNTAAYPAHWGQPPMIGTMDYRQLPGGYGWGSSTLANWIQRNMSKDASSLDLMELENVYPARWGQPPAHWKDKKEEHLPCDYGIGSWNLYHWIQQRAIEDRKNGFDFCEQRERDRKARMARDREARRAANKKRVLLALI